MLSVFSVLSLDGLATFRNFLKSEYSDENIEFWLTCEDYKKIKSSFRMSSKAKKIYEQFIKAESPKEVSSSQKALIFIQTHSFSFIHRFLYTCKYISSTALKAEGVSLNLLLLA